MAFLHDRLVQSARHHRGGFAGLILGLTALLGALPAWGQECGGRWLPGDGVPGLTTSIRSVLGGLTSVTVNSIVTWDPDGPGPATPKIAVGGRFGAAAGVAADNIAVFDPRTNTWSGLNSSGTYEIYQLIAMPNGDLIALGWFTSIGGVAANNLARWNGSIWTPIGNDAFSSVGSGAALPDGGLVVSGFPRGSGSDGVFRWSGTSWEELGQRNATFRDQPAVASLPNGDIVAAGFLASGGRGVVRWNGSEWTLLGSKLPFSVNEFAVLPNGDLVVAGSGNTGVVPILRWDGSTWRPMAAQFTGNAFTSLTALPNGDLVASGWFTSVDGVTATNIARWNGRTWSPLGSGLDSAAYGLASLPDGQVFAGGFILRNAGGQPVNGIARWTGSDWTAVGQGLDGMVNDLLALPGGDVIAGGRFSVAGWVAQTRGIALWNGSSWAALGSGTNGAVIALARQSSGAILAGGTFTSAGGVPVSNVARWNGSTWSALGSGVNGTVYALAVMPNGDVVAGGSFTTAGDVPANNIARWDGSAWVGVGTGTNGPVYALTVLGNGDLIAGGRFSTAGDGGASSIARWSGSSWTPLGDGLSRSDTFASSVEALTVLPNGDLVAGGAFTVSGGVPVNSVARWDGAAWKPLGAGVNGSVRAFAVLPTGDLIAGGVQTSAQGQVVNRIARWNGSAWFPVGSGVNASAGSRWVDALAVRPDGELVVGGYFETAGDRSSAYFARYSFSGTPAVSSPPQAQNVASGQTVTLTATPANGYAGVSVQWLRDGVPVADGPGGAAAGGGAVSGATATLASPTRLSAVTLTIASARAADAGQYAAVFTNACGSATTVAATLGVRCPQDYNGDAAVSLDDLCDFITDFYAAPSIPGGVQADAPSFAGVAMGSGTPCPAAPDAPTPYAADAYRAFGYRVGFSGDGQNGCPLDPSQAFPNLDNLYDFLTAYYDAAMAGGC